MQHIQVNIKLRCCIICAILNDGSYNQGEIHLFKNTESSSQSSGHNCFWSRSSNRESSRNKA